MEKISNLGICEVAISSQEWLWSTTQLDAKLFIMPNRRASIY